MSGTASTSGRRVRLGARPALALALGALGLLAPAAAGAGPIYTVESTCYAERGLMADGTRTRDRSVAINNLPFGSKIKLVGARTFFGRRIFVVRDRIGWGSEIDFWDPSEPRCNRWGRRDVAYVVLRRGR